MSIAAVLDSKIIVCAGSGGTGKTTVSAAIALRASQAGRNTIVVTIDPAKRLANALGLSELSNTPVKIAGTTLSAMMLDTKTTFDALVTRYARSPERASKILSNRFYQAISESLSGTHEYMAMEKLYELSNAGDYDLIVIDTPPTRSALDFIDAPRRMTSFLEGRMLKWLLLPAISGGKGLFKIANFAAVSFLKVLKRVLGSEILADVAEFFINFEGMYDGFKERALQVYELLRQPTTAFVIVTAPDLSSVDEALFFADQLDTHGLPFGGLVVNRLHPRFTIGSQDLTGDPRTDAAIDLAGRFAVVADAESAALVRLRSKIPESKWALVPYLTSDVANLDALGTVSELIFDAEAPL
ncbi:MAG: ArsA-related P-loop ATPase [Actinomycetota bacterium]